MQLLLAVPCTQGWEQSHRPLTDAGVANTLLMRLCLPLLQNLITSINEYCQLVGVRSVEFLHELPYVEPVTK